MGDITKYNSIYDMKLKEGDTAQISGKSLSMDYTKEYGKYVNNERAVPYLLDGFKPSYRKQVLGGLSFPKGRRVKVYKMIGEIMGEYYAHGDASLVGVVDELVHWGIFNGQGAFSRKFIDGSSEQMASPRYVECWMNDVWRDTFSILLPYVLTYRNEFGIMEPVYLPTPLPLCCVFGSKGIGLGARTVIPAFKPQTLLKAYKENDPSLLVSYYDYDTKQDSIDVWENPKCLIDYSYIVRLKDYPELSNKKSIQVTGETKIFVPKYTDLLNEWLEEGRVFVTDLSDENNLLVFSILNNMKYPTVEELLEQVKLSCSKRVRFEIRASFNNQVRYITLKDWIDITYNNYCRLLNEYKQDNLSKLDFQQSVIDNFESVVKLVYKKLSNKEIQEKLKIDIEIINSITNKSISAINNFDYDKEYQKIEEKRKEYKFENSDYIENLIVNFPERLIS